jgi:hypothetical protein
MKKNFSFLLLLLVTTFLSPLNGDLISQAKQTFCPPFGLMTVPKAGTHLMLKLFFLIQSREPFEVRPFLGIESWNYFTYGGNIEALSNKLDEMLNDHSFIYCHTDYSVLMQKFLSKHTDFPLLLGLRDLRDIFVSQVYFQWDIVEGIIGPSSFDDKLTFLMKNEVVGYHPKLLVIYKHATAMMRLLYHKNSLIVRFEDLIGSKGGGDDNLQRETILSIAKRIGVSLSTNQLAEVQELLFGGEFLLHPVNFRSGQIGSWKEHFKPHHIKLFSKKYGDLHKAFGYSL